MIAIRNLAHTYPGARKQPPKTALTDLDLQVEPGAFYVLTGPNGGGKSTLFKILCGLTLPSAGTVTIGGADLRSDPAAARRQMGVVFQHPALDKRLSVLENLQIHAALYGISKALFQDRLEEALTWADLEERLSHRVETLSGGLARQVELVKAFLHRPKLLLMDEPTTGLDPGRRRAFLETLLRLKAGGDVTLMMTSHIFSEAEHADRVGILTGGRLLADAPPGELKSLLGEEMVVIHARSPGPLADELAAREWLEVKRLGREIRVKTPDPLPLMEELLKNRRGEIDNLSVKTPDLEDVYIHLTGRALSDDGEET